MAIHSRRENDSRGIADSVAPSFKMATEVLPWAKSVAARTDWCHPLNKPGPSIACLKRRCDAFGLTRVDLHSDALTQAVD
jgi:hypothetical protein